MENVFWHTDFVSVLEFTDFKFVDWNNSNLRVVR